MREKGVEKEIIMGTKNNEVGGKSKIKQRSSASSNQIRVFPIKEKKAQLKIQEMSFMLLALVLFFIIAGLFFIVITNTNIKESAESLSEIKAISMISRLCSSPELGCGGSNQLCVDTDKLLVLKGNSAFDKYWDTSNGLIIKKIYPSSEGEIECNIGNYDNCNMFTLKEPDSGYIEVSSYVSLCKKDSFSGYGYDKCELGKISTYLTKDN